MIAKENAAALNHGIRTETENNENGSDGKDVNAKEEVNVWNTSNPTKAVKLESRKNPLMVTVYFIFHYITCNIVWFHHSCLF